MVGALYINIRDVISLNPLNSISILNVKTDI
jgi:hypothetical protein